MSEQASPTGAAEPAVPGDGDGRVHENVEFVILTGMSGAGRSTAARSMEDLGWYVVDNLPPEMLPELGRLASRPGSSVKRVAAVADVRSIEFFAALFTAMEQLRADGISPRIIYFDADDESLVRRFESVRRPHPLQGEGRLLDGIQAERSRLSDLRSTADLILDTSGLNVHQLTAKVRQLVGIRNRVRLRVAVVSFGFKYGVPLDADLVFDMRFLPNPFWIPELRPYSGLDEAVSEYVLARPGAQDFLERLLDLLEVMIGGYLSEGRRYITVAFGCTGGKHRSVAMAAELASRISTPEVAAMVFHRDLGRE